jgi:hypothetical protein
MTAAFENAIRSSKLALMATVLLCGTAQGDVLQGRIEQISGPNEPKLPAFKMMTPKLDARGQEEPQPKGAVATKAPASYPIDWRGNWSGELKIVSARYAEPPAELADEIGREKQLNVPGRTGKAQFKFEQLMANQISLDPVVIEFVYPAGMPRPPVVAMPQEPQRGLRRRWQRPDNELAFVPTGTYFINLNSFDNGITLGGNLSNQKVLNNSVKSLAKNVIEQDIVSRNLEELRDTDQVITEYNEDVLRFTMMSERLMLVQAASLSYNDKGTCQSVLSLVGYIHRL